MLPPHWTPLISPILCQRHIHNSCQHTHSHSHLLGTHYNKLSTGQGLKTTPRGSCPMEVSPTDPDPDQEGQQELREVSHHRALGLDFPTATSFTLLFLGQPRAGNARQSPSHTSWSPSPAMSSWKSEPTWQSYLSPSQSSALQASAFSHKERHLRSLTATHFAALGGDGWPVLHITISNINIISQDGCGRSV